MPIDLSKLPHEKQVFLTAHPELLKSLEREIPRQAAKAKRHRESRRKIKPKIDRELDEMLLEKERAIRAEAARLRRRFENLKRNKSAPQKEIDEVRRMLAMYDYRLDPALKEISKKIRSTNVKSVSKLACPVCGEADRGNKMNGKPWCMKCNSPLVPRDKVEKWKRLPRIKILSKSLRDELARLL